MPVAAIAMGVIGAGVAAGKARAKGRSERKALENQAAALKRLKTIDLEEAKKLVSEQDKAYYIQSQEFFRQQDPELNKVREQSLALLNRELAGGPGSTSEKVSQGLDALYGEMLPADPELAQARTLLRQSAVRDLQLGATLEPEMQAELVRAGLEEAGTTGIGMDKAGPVTSRLGKLLGTAAFNIQSQRQARAAEALATADAVTASRANILGSLIQNAEAAREANRALATGSFAAAEATQKPSVGLRGADLLNLQLQNLALENQRIMALGGIKAQRALSFGQERQGYISSINSGMQSMLGGLMGGAGGLLGGGGGAATAAAGGSQQMQMFNAFGGGG